MSTRSELGVVGGRASANRAQQPLGVFAEEPDQQQLLLARGHAFGLRAELAERRDDVLLRLRVVRQLDRAPNCGIDRPGRLAEEAGDERTKLVDDGEVPARRQDVEQRLRREHLADRRCERRPADLGANAAELFEHLLEPVAGVLCAQRRVDARDEAGRHVVLRCADRDARRERRNRLVADVLVDDVAGVPESIARRCPDRGSCR